MTPESPFPPLWVARELLTAALSFARPGCRLRAEVIITEEPDTAEPPYNCIEMVLVAAHPEEGA
jgi:hypothetical protein